MSTPGWIGYFFLALLVFLLIVAVIWMGHVSGCFAQASLLWLRRHQRRHAADTTDTTNAANTRGNGVNQDRGRDTGREPSQESDPDSIALPDQSIQTLGTPQQPLRVCVLSLSFFALLDYTGFLS